MDLFHFQHRQVQNFKISNLFKKTKILQSTFESTKTESKSQQSTSQLNQSKYYTNKNLWNIINNCKISQFLIKFCKSLKDWRKMLLE